MNSKLEIKGGTMRTKEKLRRTSKHKKTAKLSTSSGSKQSAWKSFWNRYCNL